MNFKRHLIVALSSLSTTIAASALDYPYMRFTAADGSVSHISCEGLDMRFVDGYIVADNGIENMKLKVSDLLNMCFDKDNDNISTVSGIADVANSRVSVHTLSGISVGTFSSYDEALSLLPTGLYIFSQEDKVIKVSKQ